MSSNFFLNLANVHNNCRVLKDLQHWKEAPIDCMMLSLYQLQVFYCKEIKRGLAGLGQYTLAPMHTSIMVQEAECLPSLSPEDIVKNIRDGKILIDEEDPAESTQPIKKAEEKSSAANTMSSLARAKELLTTDKISFDSKLHCFNVVGSSGVVRVVTIFPKESCSCPSTGNCYHLLAVKMSLGMTLSNSKVRHNLTQLRKNTRSRSDKKSGRKRPRPNDIEPSMSRIIYYIAL